MMRDEGGDRLPRKITRHQTTVKHEKRQLKHETRNKTHETRRTNNTALPSFPALLVDRVAAQRVGLAGGRPARGRRRRTATTTMTPLHPRCPRLPPRGSPGRRQDLVKRAPSPMATSESRRSVRYPAQVRSIPSPLRSARAAPVIGCAGYAVESRDSLQGHHRLLLSGRWIANGIARFCLRP